MTLRQDLEDIWENARKQAQKNSGPPPGIMRTASDPDPRWVMVNEYFQATAEALNLLADRIEAIERREPPAAG